MENPNDGNDQRECRICLGGDDEVAGDGKTAANRLLAPCRCAGSMKWVHDKCLHEWVNRVGDSQRQKSACDICGSTYNRTLCLTRAAPSKSLTYLLTHYLTTPAERQAAVAIWLSMPLLAVAFLVASLLFKRAWLSGGEPYRLKAAHVLFAVLEMLLAYAGIKALGLALLAYLVVRRHGWMPIVNAVLEWRIDDA